MLNLSYTINHNATGNVQTEWLPQVANGDFYIGDRHYYLYGKKCCYQLEELKRTTFTLTGYPNSVDSTTVTIDSTPASFEVHGNELSVIHPDPLELDELYGISLDPIRRAWMEAGYAFPPNSLIDVQYQELTESGGIIFTGNIQEQFTLISGVVSYKAPEQCSEAPIVITDDCIQPGNYRNFAVEFTIDTDYTLSFNAEDNAVIDPAFCVHSHSLFAMSYAWSPHGDVTLMKLPDAYYGKYAALMATGYYEQDVTLSGGFNVCLSAWFKNVKPCLGITGYPYIELMYKDESGNTLGTSRLDVETSNDWSTDYLSVYLPADTVRGTVRIGNDVGVALADAVQLEYGLYPTQFAFVSPASTYEAESNPTGIYKYDGAMQYPYKFDSVDVNGLNHELVHGFLTIGEYANDWHVEPIGKGGYRRYPYPTGEFMVYRGTGDNPQLAGYPIIFVEPPYCPGMSHWLDTYSKPADQIMYAILSVGTIYHHYCDYYTGFTTPGGITYPAGIQNEPWVGPSVNGESVIILPSGYPEWLDVLKYHTNTYISPYNFDGVLFENINWGTGVYPQTIAPDQKNLMANLMDDMTAYVPDKFIGIMDAEPVISGCYTGDLLGNVDSILINGLFSKDDYSLTEDLHRNWLRARTYDMLEGAAARWNTDIRVYALDYYELLPDDDFTLPTVPIETIRGARHYAYTECWSYYWGPDTLTGIYTSDHGLLPELHNYGVDTGFVPPCDEVGRKHTSWSKPDGYNKLQQRHATHQQNQVSNDDYTRPKNIMVPDSIGLSSALSTYRGFASKPYAITLNVPAGWLMSNLELFELSPAIHAEYHAYPASSTIYCTASRIAGAPYDSYLVELHSGTPRTTANRVAYGEALYLGADYTCIYLRQDNNSGLTGRIAIYRGAIVSDQFTIDVTDVWDPRSSDEVCMDLGYYMTGHIQAIVKDERGNPVDDETVFMDAHGSLIDINAGVTNRSGCIRTSCIPFQVCTGDPCSVSFMVRSVPIEQHVNIYPVGSIPPII